MSFSLLNLNLETIYNLEQLRAEAYGRSEEIDSSETYYIDCLSTGFCIAYGVFYNHELIGACYVSSAYNSLYIEQLFVMKKFQRCDLHFGSSLLKYVLSQKESIEKYFERKFIYSCLEDITKDSQVYEKIGYIQAGGKMRRKRLGN